MALEMYLANQMRMAQQMKLTPAMMQSMEILQLPLMALEQRIETELNTNPVLEVESELEDVLPEQTNEFLNKSLNERELKISETNTAESFERLENLGADYKEYVDPDADVSIRYNDGDGDPKLEALQNTADNRSSMPDYLREQLSVIKTKREVANCINIIIDHLDPKGYLPVSLQELAHLYNGFQYESFTQALKIVQQMDPPGIGARSIQECMLIQIDQNEDTPPYAKEIIQNHYDMLLSNHLPKLAATVGCSMDQLRDVLKFLSRLDINPGTRFGSGFDDAPVRVDIIIEEAENDEYTVKLAGSTLPAIRINDEYASMAADKSVDKDTRNFLQDNIRSAKWLIDAINQRKSTLLKIAAVVASKQKDFFKKGKLYLKPLFMQEVAEQIDMHIATISRAVAGKYVQCPQGQIPLRDFFTNRMTTKGGEVQGTQAVKESLRQIVDGENKSKPYNDDRICEILMEKGYEISRRTVVKYRRQLDIPTSRIRKQFS